MQYFTYFVLYTCIFSFHSPFFFFSNKQRRTNKESSLHSFPFFILSSLYNDVLKFGTLQGDYDEEIMGKKTHNTLYVKHEGEQEENNIRACIIPLVTSKQMGRGTQNKQPCYLHIRPDKSLASVMQVIVPFKIFLKLDCKKKQFHFCQKWSPPHFVSTVITVLLEVINYELYLEICKHIFSLQRGSKFVLFVL